MACSWCARVMSGDSTAVRASGGAMSLLPGKGLAAVDYRYQLWPRLEGLGTRGIADFAPGSGVRGVNNGAAVTVVPVSHPAQFGLFMLALACALACALRRRQVLRAARAMPTCMRGEHLRRCRQ